MLEDLVWKISDQGDVSLKSQMQKSILHIARIVYPPSVTSIATDTRLILSDTRTELRAWIEQNRDRFRHQRELFSEVLKRIQSLHLKINQLVKEK